MAEHKCHRCGSRLIVNDDNLMRWECGSENSIRNQSGFVEGIGCVRNQLVAAKSLIADLLAAAKLALDKFDNEIYASRTGRKPEAVEALRAAIAKAEREATRGN